LNLYFVIAVVVDVVARNTYQCSSEIQKITKQKAISKIKSIPLFLLHSPSGSNDRKEIEIKFNLLR